MRWRGVEAGITREDIAILTHTRWRPQTRWRPIEIVRPRKYSRFFARGTIFGGIIPIFCNPCRWYG